MSIELGALYYFIIKRHPKDMGIAEIDAFLGYLSVVGNVAASTQNQALSALLFYPNNLHPAGDFEYFLFFMIYS
jgi:Phage integrase, N-terminal SAM-like domain